ncbi:E3 ubiquitin-protein ligase XIAP-like [Microplitis mediator]|uniref:E3 ubiquitin-protein ligase XIAP-like n=1 Tax=Microplitis mediator TaxID=375433 RepID=UPI0025564B88|nr:E3 ubiquitin-protein ligase XIAP-like [Microplitis mediator]
MALTTLYNSIGYRSEALRIQSYSQWPEPTVSPEKLANAGFYYTGEGDSVKCFECGIVICHWLQTDNPVSDHRRWQSNCRFIRNVPCGNVPKDVDLSTVSPVEQKTYRPRYGDEFRPGAVPYSSG